MKQACFDNDGHLVWLSRHTTQHAVEEGHTIVEVDDGADANNLFFDGTNAVAREEIGPVADKTIIVADGQDAATLTGLPFPCCIRVNGQRVSVTTDSFVVKSSSPSIIHVELAGAHTGAPIIIRAAQSSDLMDEVRTERDTRLAASDWTQGRDCKMDEAKQDAWATYRQVLRDLPEQQPDVNTSTVAWPSKPA